MIYALETKAASVAKRMSTAMFVRNDIRSKYVGFLSKSVDYVAKYVRIILLDIYLGSMYMQESFTVCMCDKIGVCVCVCVSIMLLTQYHRYYEESC